MVGGIIEGEESRHKYFRGKTKSVGWNPVMACMTENSRQCKGKTDVIWKCDWENISKE